MSIYHYSSMIAKECKNEISAILFHHIVYWVEMNKKNEKMEHDNKFWVYQSYAQFKKRFSYLSIKQIRHSLKRLEEKELIISTDEYSNSGNSGIFKTTKWYTVSEEGYKVLGDDINYVTDQIEGAGERKLKKKMKIKTYRDSNRSTEWF